MKWLKRRLGVKDRLVFRCRGGNHSWYAVYGDERMFHGKWHCYDCPYGHGGPPA